MPNILKIDFITTSQASSSMIIAFLSDFPFYAFEENENLVSAYIKEEDFKEDVLYTLDNKLFIKSNIISIAEKNWNQEWEQGFSPVIINDFAAIRANFHQPIKTVKYDLIITPKMSFGTGHHATTYLMIKSMERIDFLGKKVLDFGTGTGVLAILAEKMGASVIAIDNDDWSINNTLENLIMNQSTDITVIKSEIPVKNEKFDIVLANINTHILMDNNYRIREICSNDAYILISGFLAKDVNIIIKSFSMAGFVLDSSMEQDDWYCLIMKVSKS